MYLRYEKKKSVFAVKKSVFADVFAIRKKKICICGKKICICGCICDTKKKSRQPLYLRMYLRYANTTANTEGGWPPKFCICTCICHAQIQLQIRPPVYGSYSLQKVEKDSSSARRKREHAWQRQDVSSASCASVADGAERCPAPSPECAVQRCGALRGRQGSCFNVKLG